MESISKYKYSPIPKNSIRLLNLSGAKSSHVLKSVDIANSLPYYALSYAWGVQVNDIPLQVNDQTLYLSSHLANAIQRLRKLTGDDVCSDSPIEWLWIDKICINQNDPTERSNQVQLMNRIYSRAVKTLIWLGPDDEGCSGAWQLIDQIYVVFRRETPCARSVTDIPSRLYSDEHHIRLGLPGWEYEGWQLMRMLLNLPWFSRTWIVQEVALSPVDPIIVHGQQIYSWNRLGWAASWLRRRGYLRLPMMSNQFQNVDTISNIQRLVGKWPLGALLVTISAKCHATDQRDKVYGLLGLAAESQGDSRPPDALRPDYELDVAAVYMKIARFCLEEYESLSILTRASGMLDDVSCTQRAHQIERLPSWVPNWSDFSVGERDVAKSLSWVFYAGTVNAGSLGFPEHYKASGGLRRRLFRSQDSSILRLGGLKSDVVVQTIRFESKAWWSGQHADDNALLRLWDITLSSSPEGATLVDRVVAWVKTTTADHHALADRTAGQIIKDGSAYLHNLLCSRETPESYSLWPTDKENMIEVLGLLSKGGSAEIYAALATNFCSNRKLFVTREGRLGIGPPGTQPGDMVYVLFGGEVPYVLRTQGSRFLFVGESYIHGLMGGEAIQAWERHDLEEEILELQ